MQTVPSDWQMQSSGRQNQLKAPGPPKVDYANKVEVHRNEFDVTLTFYRESPDARGCRVATVLVPPALLDALKEA